MRANESLAESLASLNENERSKVLRDLSEDEASALLYDWKFWARPNQLPPGGEWVTWLLLAGRGFGKTRVGAEFIRSRVVGPSPLIAPKGGARRIAFVAETAADARDVMVEGESGILDVSPPDQRPLYEPSKRRLTWPNGAWATLYNGREPDQLRGPQHDLAWSDELAKWRYAQDAWDQLQFGLRIGEPRQVVSTTPRPIKVLRDIMSLPDTVTTLGTTYENRANLAPVFYRKVIAKYEGTRLGRQELRAEMLEDVPGALWQRDQLDALKVKRDPEIGFQRIVVAIDPPATSGEDADEAGIVVAGKGFDGHGYVIEDLSFAQAKPDAWANKAVAAYKRHAADRIVAEINNGGEMVEHVIRSVDSKVSYRSIHASRGKVIRAEPISALYEQKQIHHIGSFPELEDQMCSFTTDFDKKTAGFSPDRVDALVWALSELMLGPQVQPVSPVGIRRQSHFRS